ncbi:HLA class II histocompatibility antigen gamma chain isoform X2 [Amblyraja radiata]|uniref:HLA class II histocompatibility antigen gamma chain isoform X2 n=1 Tax=Amblyraja radiata TaxID=386614 RepID=UPI0014028B79|nr:HLA class II histocompatibility antigen gamma chain isoform X2 [Amblyraja radiata]
MSANEQQNSLLRDSQQDIASNSDVEVRGATPAAVPVHRGLSWGRGLLYAGVSILVAMLIAGQVVGIMFLMKQQDKIDGLQKTTRRIESKYSASRGPFRPKPIMHLRPMMMDLPISYINPNVDAPKPTTPQSTTPPMTLMEQVHQLLKDGNRTEGIPGMIGSFSDNLQLLKKNLNESDWEDFESWLQNWFLFQLVQPEKKTAPTQAPQVLPRHEMPSRGRKIISSMVMSPLLNIPSLGDSASKQSDLAEVVPRKRVFHAETECERLERVAEIKPGAFHPSCDKDGNYEPKQCWPSTGYCWCSYPNGTKIEETATRKQLDNCQTFEA